MNLDEAAKRLGYFDANHVEMNIKACGKPSVEWWGLIKELVENNSVLDDVINCCKDTENIYKNHSTGCVFCIECGREFNK